MSRSTAVVACAIVCSGCRDAPNPASPSTFYVVNAVVTEALLPPSSAAIGAARVEVIEGPHAGAFCLTNALGTCTLDVGLSETPMPLVRCSREGFHPSTKRFTPVYGAAAAAFTLARDSTPDISGEYDVTVTAANSCNGLSPTNRTFSTSAIVSHPTNPSLVLLEIQIPGRCNYLFGVIRPTGDVELGHDSECDFPRPPGPVVIVATPAPRLVTAEGSWTGRVVGGMLTLAQSGSLTVTAPGADEWCQAPDHRWDFRRR